MSFKGEKLKQARLKAGVSVKEISSLLVAKGLRATPNTIYSWENNNSQPTPDALLCMCEKYHIVDPLDYFGYTDSASNFDSFSGEKQRLLALFSLLNIDGQQALVRYAELLVKSGDYAIQTEQEKTVSVG